MVECRPFLLELCCEAHLAWLKLASRLYKQAPGREEELLSEAKQHLGRIEEMIQKARQQSLVVEWNGEMRRLQRAACVDIADVLKSFEEYWGNEL